MSMIAKCKLFDDSIKNVNLEGLDSSWSPADVYEVCEDKLGVKIKTIENLEDIMAEVEYMSECKEEI